MGSTKTDHSRPTQLELDVAQLLIRGYMMAEIGKRLGISPRTAEARWRQCRLKLKARSSLHAVAMLLEAGEIKL